MKTITITPSAIFSVEDICAVAKNTIHVVITNESLALINKSFEQVKKIDEKVYGLTTGVADLSTEQTSSNKKVAQKNILLSHAAGVGLLLEKEVIRGAIFCRLLAFIKGMSGINAALVIFLTELLNKDVIPLVPSWGSIGAADMTVLAQIGASIFNKGKVVYKGKIYKPYDAFAKANISYPKGLFSREGLALIEGNEAALVITALVIEKLEVCIKKCLIAAAMTLEGRTATYAAYNKINQILKPFLGQALAASTLESVLQGSEQIKEEYTNDLTTQVQDPPSFKTISQVIGNAVDVVKNLKVICTTEINSLIDNPLFVNGNPSSSGNYLSTQLAMALDQIPILIVNLSTATTARLQILTNPQFNEGLPPYLIPNAGVNNGFMIPIYTAQSVLSEMKALCFPRSIFSSTVANAWEDISTNGMNAALNAKNVLELGNDILAIEFLLASQAVALRLKQNPKLTLGKETVKIFRTIKNKLAKKNILLPIEKDCFMADVIEAVKEIISQEKFLENVKNFQLLHNYWNVMQTFQKNKREIEKMYKN